MDIKVKYEVNGEFFDSMAEAEEYIEKKNAETSDKINKFWESYSGKNLTKALARQGTKSGFFVIKDEGPIDYSGGRTVTLGYAKGNVNDVVLYAVGLKGFWGYGPGQIEMIDFVEV